MSFFYIVIYFNRKKECGDACKYNTCCMFICVCLLVLIRVSDVYEFIVDITLNLNIC